MLYHLDESDEAYSWAGLALRLLRYDSRPRLVQRLLGLIFEHGVQRVRIPGTLTVPVALSAALDGTDSRDYSQRVEPSVEGGRKMARLLVRRLTEALQQGS